MSKALSPTSREKRMLVWDALRKYYNIKIVSSREELIKKIREKAGLKKYERAKGRVRGILNLIRKSDFWLKSREEGHPIIVPKKRRWTEGEVELLRALSKKYRGKELVRLFNRKVSPYKRTYWSVMSKLNQLKRQSPSGLS